MAETMTSLEIADIEGLCETDGEGTVSLAEEDFERICEQAKRVHELSTRLLAAERDAARLREALEQIAKPALGGKQQQYIARAALAGAQEEGR
jgi:hypothetical protein